MKRLIPTTLILCIVASVAGAANLRVGISGAPDLAVGVSGASSLEAGFVPTDVPQADADALIAFYNATDGENWTNNTGWLTDPVVGNWYGVVVSGGRVTQLNLSANGTSVSGDISGWTLPSSLSVLWLYNTSVSGDISGWTLPSSLSYLWLYNTSVSGDISGWSLPSSLSRLYLYNTSVSGDISGWTLPSSLSVLRLHYTSVSGDISGWTLPSSLSDLRLYSTSISGAPSFGGDDAGSYQVQDTDLPQSDVDAWLSGIYANRANFTDAAPELYIGGTNAAPSGTYQDGDPPTTGLEYAYELCNDPEAEGFNTWSISWNGGSCP